MLKLKFKESNFKIIVRKLYTILCSSLVLVNIFFFKKNKKINIFYGGAYAGNFGGTLVKIQRLNKFFLNRIFNFNLLYCLSNSPYIFSSVLNFAKKRGIPVIHNQNGYFYDAWYKNKWKSRNLEMSKQHKIADYVFYQSKFCKKNSKKFLQFRDGPSEILYNSVDISKFKPNYLKKKTDHIKILMTGVYNDHLGYSIEYAIRALHLINKNINAHLFLAGHYSNFVKQRIVSISAELNCENKIFFLKKYNQSEAPKIYNNHDIYFYFVQNASCSNAVIEAIACGLPVVYSNSGGTPEIVGRDGGIGISCIESWKKISNLSSKEISFAVEKILKKYNFYSRNARLKACKDHNIQNWIKRHKVIFRKYVKISN
jgi:glycosyltransferase involved in cell wall biosynthesis